MACSEIDPLQPVEFIDGGDCYIVGVLHRTGKCSFPRLSDSEHAEVYAELFEQGVRFFVSSDPSSLASGGCVDWRGVPVDPWDDCFWAAKVAVRNRVFALATEGMDQLPEWGMFA